MNALNTIFFDLDGTLLPMQQDAFLDTYLGLLTKRVSPWGYDPKQLIKALWFGTGAMMQNDGSVPNCRRFWAAFSQKLGPEALRLEAELADFYAKDFNATQAVLGPKADVKGLLSSLRRKGYGVVLATNPLFPPVAVASRLSWILLSPSDFDHVTTYDNSRFCKPHLGYYRDILAKVSREPAQCMMVGNNPVDDMAAADLGLAVYLLTDYLENPEGLEIGGYPQGSFADLAAFLGELPALPAG